MEQSVKTVCRSPRRCSGDDLAAFCRLVQEGGEVEAGRLQSRVGRARRLIFAYEAEALVGVAALKTPNAAYKRRVFQKAKTSLPNACRLELGWVFVVQGRRGRGLSRQLVEAALSGVHAGMFATSRADNVAMHHTLERCGFRRAGQPYKSDRATRDLVLYVHEAAQQGDGGDDRRPG